MRDRWPISSFVVGLLTFCAVGLFLDHRVTIAMELLTLLGLGALLALGVRADRHRRLVRRLRAVTVATEMSGVAVRTGQLGDAAFVAGLRRPTIFCGEALPERLTAGQLRAVLLHEQAHQQAHDPARLLLLGSVEPLLRRLPHGRQWSTTLLARREISADREALAHGVTPADLAAALLAVPGLARVGVGFASAVDLRLRVLLGEEVDLRPPAGVRRLVLLAAGGLVGTALCAWFLHEYLAASARLCC